MQLERCPMYLSDLSFTTERVKDSEDQTSKRIVVLCFRIQPFTRDIAHTLTPGLLSKLFDKSGEVPADLLGCEVGIAAPLVTLQLAPAPDTAPSVIITDARLGSKVALRRDKETPTYAATIRLNFAYPSGKDLLFLAHALNQQLVVTLLEQQMELQLDADEQGDAETAPVTRYRKPRAAAAAY